MRSPATFIKHTCGLTMRTSPLTIVFMKHESSCSCGQLKLSYEGDITRTTICHCLACQKRTGSVFGVVTRLEKSKTKIAGESTVYTRIGDEGNEIKFHFCPKCGSTVYYEAEWLQDNYAAPIGGFADPTLPVPARDVYRNRKHHWVILPDAVEEMF